MVAHNPLHGSGRAALLHPALALGNNAKALPGIRMTNVSLRDPASHSALHLSPGDTGFLATALKHPPPEPSHGHAKVTDRHRIHRHRVIAHISENHRAHILPHCGNRRVHASPEFGFDFLEFALPSLAHRLPQHHKSSLTGLRAAVSETQKVKGLGFSFASALPVLFCMPAKLDQARLLGMKFQSKAPKPLHKLAQKSLPVLSVLKSNNEVIGKPHHNHISLCLKFSPLLYPQIKHIVQIEVGQKRTDASALYRPHLSVDVLALLQHSHLEPLLDQPYDAPIRHAVLDKFHQPSVVESVKETADVGIEHPVHLSLRNPNAERIQRLMRTSCWSKTVGKSHKVLFVKSTKHFGRGALNNFIFQHEHSERTKLLWLASLGNIGPTHRLRSVRSSFDLLRKGQKSSLKPLLVLPPRCAVDAWGCLSLQSKVGPPKSLNVVNMMQQSREPLPSIPPCCLTYPLKRAGHAHPALSPEHVTLGRPPLGQPPSLHRLLSFRLGLVRRLRRYYGSVRLPVAVHHRGASLDFPMRSVLPTDRHGISRLPLKVLACMHRVLDRARSKSISRYRRFQSCLPLRSRASAPRSGHRLRDGGSISRLNTWPARTPVNASPSSLQTKVHDSETVWIATPSLYETFIHNTLPTFTGASDGLNDLKIEGIRREQLFRRKLLLGQSLLVEVGRQRLDYMAILFQTVAPRIVAKDLLLLFHRPTEPRQADFIRRQILQSGVGIFFGPLKCLEQAARDPRMLLPHVLS